MDKKELSRFKKILENRQQTLHDLDEISDDVTKVVELDQTRVGRISRMDALQGQAMSLEVQRRRQIECTHISAALNRIELDIFGVCVECDNEIFIKRLELNPSAPLCINCASKFE